MHCGLCGGGFSKISLNHFGCSTARNKGPTACSNHLTIRRDVLEGTVLDGLRGRLMDPEVYAEFAKEFATEWNRLQAGAAADHESSKRDLTRTSQQIERLVDALAAGAPVESVKGRLFALEVRKNELEAAVQCSPEVPPRLHPRLADIYRERVAELIAVLNRDDATETREALRALIEAIVLTPQEGRLTVQIKGELAAVLAMGRGARAKEGGTDTIAEQVKMVAGTGFEPVTFRL